MRELPRTMETTLESFAPARSIQTPSASRRALTQ